MLGRLGSKQTLPHVITPALPPLHQIFSSYVVLPFLFVQLQMSECQLVLACCPDLHDLFCMVLYYLS